MSLLDVAVVIVALPSFESLSIITVISHWWRSLDIVLLANGVCIVSCDALEVWIKVTLPY